MNKERQFRILIVEDELPLAQHLANRITACSSRYVIAGLAQNGAEGLELLERCRPDIVFTDIQMPVCNGLDFLAQATSKYPNTKYVILSGFSDFQYAQAGIKYGVKAYLLKPVSDEELHNALAKITEEIEITDVPARYAELHTFLMQPPRENSPHKEYPRYHLALLTMGNCVASSTPFSQEISENFESLFNSIDFPRIFKQCSISLPAPPYLMSNPSLNARYLVVESPELSSHAFFSFCTEVHAQLKNYSQLPPISITCHTGALSAQQLYSAGRNLGQYYLTHFSPWKSVVLENSASEKFNCSYSALQFDSILQAFQIGHYDAAQQALYSTLKSWYDENLPVVRYYQNIQFLLQNLRRSVLDLDASEWEHLLMDTSIYYFFSPSLQDFCKQEFSLLANTFHIEQHTWSLESLVDGIRLYIDEHYREPINLCDLAEQFYISPSHLSRQFKTMYGCTPSNYLIDLRISRARQLLEENPDMEAKSVSLMVGYSDQFYFSKIFKKHTGYAPSEYRKIGAREKEDGES